VNRDKWVNRTKLLFLHTISQFCPVKLSKHSHLYDPGRLIQVLAALHGCIVLHSSISFEQSIPVQPGSRKQILLSLSTNSLTSYHKHKCNYLVNQYIDSELGMDSIDIHQYHIGIDHQQILEKIFLKSKWIHNFKFTRWTNALWNFVQYIHITNSLILTIIIQTTNRYCF
jgi:hypothetical protein